MARTLLGLVGAALAVAGVGVLLWQSYYWLRLGMWFQEPVLLGLQQLGWASYPSDCGGWMGVCRTANAIPLTWALWTASYLALKARGLATATPARKA